MTAGSQASPAAPAVRYSGRDFTPADIDTIRALAAAIPVRRAIADAVCEHLGWVRPDGRPKDMSCRVALLRMRDDGLITLPPPINSNGNGRHARHLPDDAPALPAPATITADLRGLGQITITVVSDRAASRQWNQLIRAHHYLGYTPLAGAQLRYLIECPHGTIAALAFAASAYKCAPRDQHIGWDPATRQANLQLIAGNARFLILPHVRVPNLASAILAKVTRRLPADWQQRYGYTPVLLETFIETGRFTGASYKAANWTRVGQTQGRGKLDRHHHNALPVKDIYIYPLHRHYQQILNNSTPPAP